MISRYFHEVLQEAGRGEPPSQFVAGEELDGNGDCVHKAVDSVEPDSTGKVDQGTKEGTTRAPTQSHTTVQHIPGQETKISNQIVDKIDV